VTIDLPFSVMSVRRPRPPPAEPIVPVDFLERFNTFFFQLGSLAHFPSRRGLTFTVSA
jgi:hypothetical protein